MKMHSHASDPTQQRSRQLASGLAWLGIGLGLAELLAPRALARFIGVPNRPFIFALLGLRELASGLGILQERRTADWLWGRVAGDVMDLSLLGAALASDESDSTRVEATAAAVLGVTVLDVLSARRHTEHPEYSDGSVHFTRTITVNRTPDMVYSFWRNFENLPRFMRNLESVTVTGLTHSHWVAKAPGGKTVEWDAEITEDIPNQLISWRSVEGSPVENEGMVRFEEAPSHRGTIIRVEMKYCPPAGKLGAYIAKLLGRAPEQEVEGDLCRFKQVLETGRVTTTEGQSAGQVGL
jgi:uncharacterized membrane protein